MNTAAHIHNLPPSAIYFEHRYTVSATPPLHSKPISKKARRDLSLINAMAPVQIAEVKGNTRENRTAAHSHIKGLGLRADGYAEQNGQGFVGQTAAREVSARAHRPSLIRVRIDAYASKANEKSHRHAASL